jgi:hypothetical protein
MASDDLPFIIYNTPKRPLSIENRSLIASRAASLSKHKRPVISRAPASSLIDHSLCIRESKDGPKSRARENSHLSANGNRQRERTSTRHPHSASPITILRKGNSDPFSTFPVPVNARVNRLLSFGRDCVDPAYRSGGPRGFKPSNLGFEFSHYQSLTDTCTGYIVLSFFASCMAVVASQAESTTESLVLRSLGSEILRRQIIEHDILSSPAAASLVYRMYRTEVLDNNVDGAQVHARMLIKLFTSSPQPQEGIDLALLTLVIYQGNHLSTAQFIRPPFNDSWVKQVFSPSWIQAGAIIDIPWHWDTTRLDPTVSDVRLQGIFRDLQSFYHTSEEVSKLCLPSGPSTWYFFVSQCEWLQMRLMNCYHDIREDEINSLTDSRTSSAVQSCLCLAALFTLRNRKNNPVINGTPLYKSSTAIYQKLEEGLIAVDTFGRFDDLSIYSNAILWVLFVLAVAEHDLKASVASGLQYCHQKRLVKQARIAHIYTWREAQAVFNRFAFSENDLPQPHDHWFDQLLRCKVDNGTKALTTRLQRPSRHYVAADLVPTFLATT